jgi:hypothetical protein
LKRERADIREELGDGYAFANSSVDTRDLRIRTEATAAAVNGFQNRYDGSAGGSQFVRAINNENGCRPKDLPTGDGRWRSFNHDYEPPETTTGVLFVAVGIVWTACLRLLAVELVAEEVLVAVVVLVVCLSLEAAST